MRLSKEEFVGAINILEEMVKKADMFSTNFCEGQSTILDHFLNNYYNLLFKVSDVPIHDIENLGGYNDLDYFVWELEFGRKYEPGMVMDNGEELKLETAEDCYDLLAKLNGGFDENN